MTIPVTLVLILAFSHWIGDYVLQSGSMAQMKSWSNRVLFNHVSLWLVTLTVGLLIGLTIYPTGMNVKLFVHWLVLQGAGHFCVDYITSRMARRAKELGKESRYWKILGFDQFLHLVFIVYGTAYILA